MGAGSSSQIAGYRYYAGLHLVFCHSLDALLGIKIGGKWAWQGEATENQALTIDKPSLFGGDDSEGGIVGTVDVCFGERSQAANGYLQSVLGAAIPAFRGLFGLIFRRGQVSSNSTYLKEWGVLGRRVLTGWNDDLAGITESDGYKGMNPAHLVREIVTNTTWGGYGYPSSDLDDDSFLSSAQTLYDEGLGINIIWGENSSVEDFLKIILDHADAMLFFSHVTGLLTMRLVRNDYNQDDLPVISPSNELSLIEYSVPSATNAVNQVTVTWVDRENVARATTVQDLAGIARSGGQIIASTLSFPGIATEDWAQKIAARELMQLCLPISMLRNEANRTVWALEPGDCFVFDRPSLGISGVVMRVQEVEIGAHADNKLRITALRDTYGLGPVLLSEPQDSLWTSPTTEPASAIRRQIKELTWWQFTRAYGESAAVLAELNDDSTMIIAYCDRPSADAKDYEMWSRNAGESSFARRDTDSFPEVLTIASALGPAVSSVISLQDSSLDTNLVKAGLYAALGGEEIVAITAVDPVEMTITVDRGVLDTIPISHDAGTMIWVHDGFFGLDSTDRAVGEEVEVRLLTSTSEGRLDIEDAETDTITCVGRMMRPYPLGNVLINGARWPESIGSTDELSIAWSHRDRTLQTVDFVRQDASSIGPEDGVTYTLRIYGESDTLLRTESGITTTSYTYTSANEMADSGFDPARLNTALRIEIESVRGELASLYHWDLSITRE